MNAIAEARALDQEAWKPRPHTHEAIEAKVCVDDEVGMRATALSIGRFIVGELLVGRLLVVTIHELLCRIEHDTPASR